MFATRDLPAVISATADDLDTITGLFGHTYLDDPVARWVAPDLRERSQVLRGWHTLLIEHALTYGAVDLLADRSGAAIWLDRTQSLPGPLDDEHAVVAGCGLAGLDVMMVEHVGSHHRYPHAHHHLARIGVRSPVPWSRLHALLDHRHAVLDRTGIPATADSSSGHLNDLLTLHGYRLGEPYLLPDGPQLRPALRPAAGH